MSVSCCKPEDITDICDALRYLVPYVQFKIYAKHPSRNNGVFSTSKIRLPKSPESTLFYVCFEKLIEKKKRCF